MATAPVLADPLTMQPAPAPVQFDPTLAPPAVPPLGPTAAVQPPADDPNVLTFTIPNTDTAIQIDLQQIPPHVRLDQLRTAVRNYVVNSVNQVYMRYKKAMEPFEAYDNACKADPLQTAVPKPTGDLPVVDLLAPAREARQRLYEGKVRKQGEGDGKKREKVDPLTRLVTEAVLRELFDKKKEAVSGYKWTDAVKEVGSDGIKYLNARIDEKVAAGGDRAVLEKFRDERYVNPAKMMLGQRDNKATKDQSLF